MFIADCHLGRLAKYLRLLGFDTLYYNSISDDELIEQANVQSRIILTRDRGLYERHEAKCIFLEEVETRSQLLELIGALKLRKLCRPFSRCLRCNALLEPVAKEAVMELLPPKVVRFFDDFQRCPSCGRIFWHGDHYRHMQSYVDTLFHDAKSRET
jgi:hypothetical protein